MVKFEATRKMEDQEQILAYCNEEHKKKYQGKNIRFCDNKAFLGLRSFT